MAETFLVVLTALIFSVSVQACRSRTQFGDLPGTDKVFINEGLNLTREDQLRLEKQANAGSTDAANQLCLYWSLIRTDEARGLHWAKRAAELGGEKEKANYQTLLETYQHSR